MTKKNYVNDIIFSQSKYLEETKYKYIILILAVLSAFYGQIVIFDYIITLTWIAIAIATFNKEDFWILFVPLSIFENTIFFFSTNYTIFKILLIMGVLKITLSINLKTKIYFNSYFLIFIMLLLYALIFLKNFLPGTIALFMCILSIFMICLTCYKLKNLDFFNRSMYGFALFAVSAGVYGLLHGNSLVFSSFGETTYRFTGTSSDPNIMGYKFIIGLIAVYFSNIIKNNFLRSLMEIFLIIMIFITASTTAIIALCLFIFLSMIFQKKSLRKIVSVTIFLTIGIIIILNIENILLYLSRNNIFGINGNRLLDQYYSFVEGDFSKMTSLRTDIWKGYINYFFNKQGFFAQLFGGNVSNIYGIEKNFAEMSWNAAAHNTNIDILMGVGIVGIFIIYFVSIKNLIIDIKKYLKNKSNTTSITTMRIITKILTIFYSFSLSLFLSYGFMVFFM